MFGETKDAAKFNLSEEIFKKTSHETMNPSNTKFSSIIPKCLKAEDPEAEIFLRNQDLLEGFMSDVKDPNEVDLEDIDDILQNMIELIQNLVQWNESSKATSGGASHSLKIDFFEIPAMVGNFFSFRGLPTTKFFFLASKVGDEKSVK